MGQLTKPYCLKKYHFLNSHGCHIYIIILGEERGKRFVSVSGNNRNEVKEGKHFEKSGFYDVSNDILSPC